jgi:hypothetical protein
MYIDQNEIVRVRIEVDEFYDHEPGPPKAADGVRVEQSGSKAPYTITVRLNAAGQPRIMLMFLSSVFYRRTGPRSDILVESSRATDGRGVICSYV